VPDQLRREWVDTLRFELTPEGVGRIIPSPLRDSGGGRSVQVDVEARVTFRPHTGADTRTRIEVAVGPTSGTWVGLAGGPALLFGLGVYQLFRDPPSVGAFLLVAAFGCVLAGVELLHARSVVSRAWPGLLAEAQRRATGTLYVPAA
jgi:hypothetical protein